VGDRRGEGRVPTLNRKKKTRVEASAWRRCHLWPKRGRAYVRELWDGIRACGRLGTAGVVEGVEPTGAAGKCGKVVEGRAATGGE